MSKGHCKIPFEDGDEDETAEFYEYGGSDEDDDWEDDEDDNTDDEEIDEEFSQADFASKKNKRYYYSPFSSTRPSHHLTKPPFFVNQSLQCRCV